MKVAIVHDSLKEFAGAERVLASLIEIWPKADIYTPIINKKVLKLLPKANYKELFLGKIPWLNKKCAFLQPLAPLVWKSLSLRNYDLIISSSSFGLSNTINTKNIPHIAYIHRPPKNLYGLSYKWTLQKLIPYSFFIKKYYESHLKKEKYVLTSSKHMRKLIKNLFNIKAKVIYPPIKIPKTINKKPGKYFVTASRLDKEKRVDLAIRACNKLKLTLKVLGTGKELNKLKKIAGPTIEFLGFLDKEKNKIYQNAKAFIFCAKNEDFGMAPLEATANGLPVIAHFSGGLKETVINNKTGLFYYQHTVKSLANAIKKINPKKFNPKFLHQYSQKFSEKKFKKEFKNYALTRINSSI